MIAQLNIINISVVSGCYLSVIGVIYWASRTKVNNKTFDVERGHNQTDHENIRKWIEDAEERAKENHDELTRKLDKIEDLIRNNGHATPRIRT